MISVGVLGDVEDLPVRTKNDFGLEVEVGLGEVRREILLIVLRKIFRKSSGRELAVFDFIVLVVDTTVGQDSFCWSTKCFLIEVEEGRDFSNTSGRDDEEEEEGNEKEEGRGKEGTHFLKGQKR